ncbi:primase C-terminal domain-containing protein [Jannaschia sp. 2305UL9-9]|uniref:primase alpha helix C-terminal domain-containing protein n=1 Tax=Jannaschia sp. 2305UL9-9 TaxID=3121638 RepID=UPI003529984C
MPLANKKGSISPDALMRAFPCDQSVLALGQPTGEVRNNGKVEFAFSTEKRAPDKADFRRHLLGQPALAVCPFVDGKSKVRWACIDIDQYGEPGLAARIETQTREFGWPCLVSESKSGGAYVWFFFRKPTPMAQVQPVLFAFVAALRVQKYDLFPATAKKEGAGRTVTLPFCGTTRRGLWRGEYVDQVAWCAKAAEVATEVDSLRALETDAGPYAEWQPCIERKMAEGVLDGERNEWMHQYAINTRRVTDEPERFADVLRDANEEHFDPPLPDAEVRTIQKNVLRKDYEPACNGVLKPICNCMECLRRKFGIGDAPPVANLRKIPDELKPLWTVEVNGKTVLLPDTEHLLNQGKFIRRCVEDLSVLLDEMPKKDWTALVKDLLRNVEEVSSATDSGPVGRLREYLYEYVRVRKTEVTDAVLDGAVVLHRVDGEPWIQLGQLHFMKRLQVWNFRELSQSTVLFLLRKWSAEPRRDTVKGTDIDTLWPPYPEEDSEEEFDVPNFEQEEGY